MKKILSVLAVAMLATSASAQISYDYLEAGYEKVTFKPFELSDPNTKLVFDDIDGDGPVFEAALSLGENYFAYADFDFARMDVSSDLAVVLGIDLSVDSVIDLSTQVLGIGYHTDGDRQLVAKVAFSRWAVDSAFWKEATLGYAIELGGRGLLSDSFEWEANIDYIDFDANDGPSGELGVNAALRYHFGNSFSTDFSASTTDDEVTYGLNFRFNFSRQ